MRALKPLYSSMHFNMFIKVSPLGEAEFAVRVGAGVGSFIGVDAEMVKEVVPLAEMFPAIFMVTFQNLYIPLGFGILECEYSEFLSVRNVLLDLY